MKQPLVSIVIPVYNGSDYLREAINSALAQTYSNIEILVVNDGSNDGGKTREIALSYKDKIRYFEKENGGVSSALNYGIQNMKGEYFSWLSHDDVYEPRKIEHQVELLQRFNDKNCIFLCGGKTIDGYSKIIHQGNVISSLPQHEIVDGKKVLTVLFTEGNFGGCEFLISKEVFDICGLFDEELRYVQDFLMWIRIFSRGYKLVYSGDFDVLRRVHKNQLTQRGRNLFHKESILLGDLIIPDLLNISTKNENVLYLFAAYNAKYNNKDVVKACINALKEKELFSLKKQIDLFIKCVYGSVRPFIRKVYYRVFRKINVK